MTQPEIIEELRRLILRAAPDPRQAAPVSHCDADQALDELIPFSSLIVLGTVVAIEDRFGLTLPRDALAAVASGPITLSKLARLVGELAPRCVEG